MHLLHPELGDPALSPAWLGRLVPGYRDVPTWACGPAPLIAAVQAAYDGSDALRVEYFKPPRTATSGEAGGEVHPAHRRAGTCGDRCAACSRKACGGRSGPRRGVALARDADEA